MTGVPFGLFDWIDRREAPLSQIYEERWAASFVKLWADHGDTTYVHRASLDAALRHETILAGSPARVRAQVARLIEATGVDYVICCFAWGDLTLAQSLRSLRLFAEQVMPIGVPARAPARAGSSSGCARYSACASAALQASKARAAAAARLSTPSFR